MMMPLTPMMPMPDAGMMMPLPPMMPMPDGLSAGDSLASAFTLASPLGVFECLSELPEPGSGETMSRWQCVFNPSNEEMQPCPGMEIVADTPTSFFRCIFDGPRVECHIPVELSGRSQVADKADQNCNVSTGTVRVPQKYAPQSAAEGFTISLTEKEGANVLYSCTEKEGPNEWVCTYLGKEEVKQCPGGAPTYALFPGNDFCEHFADGKVVCSMSKPGNATFSDIQYMC